MARNRKPEYIKKLVNTAAPNGYKFDLANYLYNPSFDYEYPSFTKKITEDGDTESYRRIYFFKYYDGTGEYIAKECSRKKNGETWQVVKTERSNVLEKSNRFSLKKLLSLCV